MVNSLNVRISSTDLCYLSRRQLPKRIRAFVDFMTTQVCAWDLDVSNIE